jgi:GNAT superfamily N-acetyltransferase
MTEDVPTSPGGGPIDIHPIRRDELGKVLMRCLPDGYRIETMFKTQEVIGIGAWDGDKCIAQLHCYRLVLPHGSADIWPAWTRPSYVAAVLDGCLGISGPVWCHACFHVGRSVESFAHSDVPDSRYFGRGIGTALARASIRWAEAHDYAAVLAPGTPDGLFAFAVWAGGLPWTTYRRSGFSDESLDAGDDLPEWARNNAPPEVMEQVKAALAAGRPKRELHSKLMVRRLEKRTGKKTGRID